MTDAGSFPRLTAFVYFSALFHFVASHCGCVPISSPVPRAARALRSIGRTGRAGHKGTATSFMGEYDLRIAKELVLVLNEAGQEVPKFLKSMAGRRAHFGSANLCWSTNYTVNRMCLSCATALRAARGPVYNTDGPAFSGRPAKRSDRDIDCAEPEPEVQKIGADLAAFGTAAAAADDDPGFWSD